MKKLLILFALVPALCWGQWNSLANVAYIDKDITIIGDWTFTGTATFDVVVVDSMTIEYIDATYLDADSVIIGSGAPGIKFGDGDTWIYEKSDDNLVIKIAGNERVSISSTAMIAGGVGNIGWGLALGTGSSATSPSIRPVNTDNNTGIGRAAEDSLSLIAGGIEAARYEESGGFVTMLRDSLRFHQEASAVEDDGEITLATGISGWGEVMAGDSEEWAHFRFKTDGTVVLISNSTNVASTDSDGNLCIYDAGSGIAVKNRLGAAKTLALNIDYFTP